MTSPTQQELDTTRETLEWLKEYTERTEPYATNLINACEMVLMGMMDEEEIKE